MPIVVVSAALAVVVPPLGVPLLGLVLSGILLHMGDSRRWDWRMAGLAGSVPLIPPLGLAYWLFSHGSSRALILAQWKTVLEQNPALYRDPEMFVKSIESMMDLVARLIPALTLLTALFIGLGALGMGVRMMRRRGIEPGVDLAPFAMWDLPVPLLWFLAAGGVAALSGYGPAVTVGLNILAVTVTAYSLRGVAVVWYGFEIRETAAWLRGLFLIFVVITLHLGVALTALLGLMETWVPFRANMAKAAGGVPDEEERDADHSS